jgi:hypothetical protein
MAEDLKRTLAVGEFLRVESMSDGILRLVFKADTPPYYRRADGGPIQWTHAVDMPASEVIALVMALGGTPPT